MKELEQGSQRQIYNTRIYNELSGYLFAFQNDSISYMSIIQDQEIISTSLSSFMEVPYQLRSSLIARAQSREGATTVVPDFGSQYGIFIVKELRKIDKLSLEPLGVLIISLNPAALTETAVSSHSDYDDMSCLLFDGDALIYNGSTLSDRQAVELSKICREITELKKPAKRPYSPSGEKSLSMTGIIFLPYRTVLFTKPSLYQEGSSCLLWWLLWLWSAIWL